jgi:hypothetical protein
VIELGGGRPSIQQRGIEPPRQLAQLFANPPEHGRIVPEQTFDVKVRTRDGSLTGSVDAGDIAEG